MQSFILDRHTDPNNPTMKVTQDDKIPVYDSLADAQADIANLEEGQIGLTEDTGATEKVVDVVQDGNMNPVTSNAVYDNLQIRPKVTRGSGYTLAEAFDNAHIQKNPVDIFGICDYVAETLIKTSAVADNTVTLHNHAVGGPAFAIILQKLNTNYGAAIIFNYGSDYQFLFRYTNNSYHIQLIYN